MHSHRLRRDARVRLICDLAYQRLSGIGHVQHRSSDAFFLPGLDIEYIFPGEFRLPSRRDYSPRLRHTRVGRGIIYRVNGEYSFVGGAARDNNEEIYSGVERYTLITFTPLRCYQHRRLSFYDLYLLNDRARTFRRTFRTPRFIISRAKFDRVDVRSTVRRRMKERNEDFSPRSNLSPLFDRPIAFYDGQTEPDASWRRIHARWLKFVILLV